MSNAPDDGPTPADVPSSGQHDDRLGHLAASPDALRFEDIFALEDIQRIQDAFAEAADVASLITDPQGRPLTRPSNFTALCRDVVRGTAKGLANCRQSDALFGRSNPDGPIIGRCHSAGLLDGGTCIYFGRRHIATWLVGQVMDESVAPADMLAYAREIGADETVFLRALEQVPRMSRERFAKICQALHRFANHLSAMALRAHQQSELIGELRQAQAGIKERDRNLAVIVDFLPDPTLVVDAAGAVVFWNRAMEKLTGISAVDMLGKSGFEYGKAFYGYATPLLVDYARGAVTRPDARYAVAEIGQDAIIAEVTVATVPSGPRHVWAKAVALRDETGRIVGGIETIRDVTDRYKSELALRESEEKFRRIVETANEGVWVLDADHHTTFVNRRLADMLGYAPGEMLGTAFDDFVARRSRDTARAQLLRLRQGLPQAQEHKLRRKDGGELWTLISASPIQDAYGHYQGAIGMLTDISERKKTEEALANHRQRLEAEVEERTRDLRHQANELAEANIRLSELDRMKSVFLSTVSHELRTPLTSILGFAKLIGRDFAEQFLPLAGENPTLANKGRRISDNLAVIFGEAERLTRLINDVLDLSRIESGNMRWHDVRFAPAEVLARAAKTIEGLLGQRPEVAFSFVIDDQAPELYMDPDQLTQVVSNLLQNAVKFTRAGEVRLELRRDGEAALIVVSDTGIGIPDEELDSIFNKFHQVGRGDTIQEATKGTGLGLAICRQIVKHYGGRIWVESCLDHGSAFHVRLPAAPPDAAEAAPEAGEGP
jgi:PAS domain S-box-containing protein